MPVAYSYIRFSTPEQKLGESLTRQLSAAQAYAAAHGLALDDTMRDEGLSGYHGRHVQRDGALGGFLDRVKAGQVAKGSVLIVEHLDRLSRQEPGVAQEQLLGIINRGVDVVTLADGVRYTKGQTTQLFLSLGIMIGNHSQSAVKADRTREHHKMARGTIKALPPSWIKKVDVVRDGKRIISGRFEIDEAKANIIRQWRHDLLTCGMTVLAQRLNKDGVPTLRGKMTRTKPVWDCSMIKAIVRSRSVLGEQAIWRYDEHGKRMQTGEVVKDAFPAIWTEAEWYAVQQALDGRRMGTHAADGRKTKLATSLFGRLAVCSECGNRMIVASRGRGNHLYLTCTMGRSGGCSKKYHRLDRIEAAFLRFFGEAALGSITKPEADPTEDMRRELDQAKAEAARLQSRHIELTIDGWHKAEIGSIERTTIDTIKRQHDEKSAAVKRLESSIAAKRIETPVAVQFETLRRMVIDLDKLPDDQRIRTRSRIADALPSIVRQIRINPKGETFHIDVVDDLPLSLPDSMAGDMVRAVRDWRHGIEIITENGEGYINGLRDGEPLRDRHIRTAVRISRAASAA